MSTESFDDPSLKDAVDRCWACECAPDRLRRRVESLCGTGRRRHHWAIWPVAAAASVALTFGLLLGRSPEPTRTAGILPVSLQGQLVDVHDRCTRQSMPLDRLHPVMPVGPAIAQDLRSKVSHPVLVVRPAEDGWNFRGANVCPVGDTRSAHVVFVNGDASLSVFSLPGSVAPSVKEGTEFDSTNGGHRIAGFVSNGAVFCLVGNAVSADRLDRMRRAMEPQVTADIPPSTAVEVAFR